MEQSYLDSFGCVKQCWISQYLSITSFEKKKKKSLRVYINILRKYKLSSPSPSSNHHSWTRVFELNLYKLKVSVDGPPAVVTGGFSFYQNSGWDLLGI